MTDAPTAAAQACAQDLERLRQALGGGVDALGGVLLAYAARLRLAVSVKHLESGRYVWVNPPMAALLGRPGGEIVDRVDADLMPSSQWTPLRSADLAAAQQPDGTSAEHRYEGADGRRDYAVQRFALPPAAPTHVLAIWSDLSEGRQREQALQKALAQLEEQQRLNDQMRREGQDPSLRDGVTGLYTNAHFVDLLRREIDLSSREHREFALVFVTLDPRPGRSPQAAERVLAALGRQLRGNTRAMDAACRLDDAHFAVLFSGVGLATAHARMEGLRRQCERQLVVADGQEIPFTVSMGVASYPHTADAQDGLIEAADKALAEAVRRGGNHVALASIRFEGQA